MNKPLRSTVPVAQSRTNQCSLTPPWFLNKSEYHVLTGNFKLLTNGEAAFGEIHRAIAAAERSVHIIGLAFQPSMHFIRDGKSPNIGQLLEQKAMDGKMVRLLCFTVDPIWLPFGITGKVPGEANTPGRRGLAWHDRPPTMTDEQWQYDLKWFGRYNQDFKKGAWDRQMKESRHHVDARDMLPLTNKLIFRDRGFSPSDRWGILFEHFTDAGVSWMSRGSLALGPSHHQKMVLIDYEDRKKRVAFVMGHNMLDEYWDKDDHSYRAYPPNLGRNGSRPRRDFSCRLTGPIVGDVFKNFAQAWQRETGETLPALEVLEPVARVVMKQDRPPVQDNIAGQVLRTQKQENVQDIGLSYLQAVGNASQYIYIENQYFRWQPLADRIKQCASGQTGWGRVPEIDGPLYLFVITNSDDEGMGSGVYNTYRMFDGLGRSDLLPEVARDFRPGDYADQIAETEGQIKSLEGEQNVLSQSVPPTRRGSAAAPAPALQARIADNEKQIQALRLQKQALKEKLQSAKKDQAPETAQDGRKVYRAIKQEAVPGLKVHICTLVSADSPGRKGTNTVNRDGRALTREERIDLLQPQVKALEEQRRGLDRQAELFRGALPPADLTAKYAAINQQLEPLRAELVALQDPSNPADWVEVYVHAKLMLIDDTFMILGSANINTRSMEVDSELAVAHCNHEITQPTRQKLWGMHTKEQSGMESLNAKGMEGAYKSWAEVIKKNKDRRAKKLTPIASLVEFYSGTKNRANQD